MKCDALIRLGYKSKRSKTLSVVDCKSWWWTKDQGICWSSSHPDCRTMDELLAAGYTRCEGTVTASVRAVDEPEMGDHFAVLEIDYTCEKCGNKHFPHLPHSAERLSDLLTAVLADYDDTAARQATRLAELRRQQTLDDYCRDKGRTCLSAESRAELDAVIERLTSR